MVCFSVEFFFNWSVSHCIRKTVFLVSAVGDGFLPCWPASREPAGHRRRQAGPHRLWSHGWCADSGRTTKKNFGSGLMILIRQNNPDPHHSWPPFTSDTGIPTYFRVGNSLFRSLALRSLNQNCKAWPLILKKERPLANFSCCSLQNAFPLFMPNAPFYRATGAIHSFPRANRSFAILLPKIEWFASKPMSKFSIHSHHQILN